MAETYTIADLCALPDDALDTMAADLRGWKLEEDEYPPELAPMRKSKTVPVWIDGNGRFTGYAPASMAGYVAKWRPATDRNQSYELLSHAESKKLGFMIDKRGNYLPPRIVVYGSDSRWLCEILSNDARAETIAFCAAMLAMAGRLKENESD